MAGKIPQHFIDELLNRIDIVDIIDAYVPLKKAGKNHQACCPFHDEKTPSFTVSQQKQFYHCFGCGANGSAISFLMEYLHMGFIEAIEDLASRAGMEIPKEAIQISSSNSSTVELYELMEMVTRFYSQQLRKHKDANTVIDYLKGRGISGEIAAEYELGFAPEGWDNLISELGKSQDALKRLLKIGTIIEKEQGGHYDRFRNRLMFPIRDQRGRAIGLGGRVLDDGTPKYLNSPETPIFHKGRELYGLYQARKSIKDNDSIYIVEGYMDVIALAQYGVRNVVASLGTAATPEHLEKLFRITSKVIFCFDGDEAGNKAAWRALENSLPLLHDGKQILFQFLPQGDDPDTFIRTQGKDAFLDESSYQPLSTFLFETTKRGVDLSTPEGRTLLIEKTIPYIFKLPTGTLKALFIEELARLARCTTEAIEELLLSRTRGKDGTKVFNKSTQTKDRELEKIRWSIRSLLLNPVLAKSLNEEVDNLSVFNSPAIIFLVELLLFIKEGTNIKTSHILENWRDTKFKNRLHELVKQEAFFNEIGVTEQEFRDSIHRIIDQNCPELDSFDLSKKPSQWTEEDKENIRLSIQRLHEKKT